MQKLETEQLKMLLSNVYKQGNEGANFQEIMNVLKEELSKMTVEQQLTK